MVSSCKPILVALCGTFSLLTMINHFQGTAASNSYSWHNNNHLVEIGNESHHFLNMIFRKFASNITGTITIKQFQNLLDKLHIGGKEVGSKDTHETDTHRGYSEDTDVHIDNQKNNGSTGKYRRKAGETNEEKKGNISAMEHSHHSTCMTKAELLKGYDIDMKTGISEESFIQVCPAMIYQIVSGLCVRVDRVSSSLTEHNMKEVWGYGFLSITITSLSSLLVIAIIPLIGHSVYHKLMSFLVALAVGTLSGDALLHLIPHAFIKSEPHEHNGPDPHTEAIWKSCTVMAGIYIFFIVETVMKTRGGGHSHAHSGSQTGLKHGDCENKPGSDTKTNVKQNCKSIPKSFQKCLSYSRCDVGSRLAGVQSRNSCLFENILSVNNIESESTAGNQKCGSLVALNWENEEANCMLLNRNQLDNNSQNCNGNIRTLNDNDILEDSTDVNNTEGILSQKHKGHSHHGNKKIDVTTSIASVAWMVIVSDGFHNFSDGLAVGAAFATSLSTGLTTAIAVFCHEIPHELGDFAILVKSGLTIKQAISYNMASAVISYIGLILGIFIGNIESAHVWVLALTAGMFLYVSLVDMLPELSSFMIEGTGGITTFICQTLGMLFGIVIMLTIALMESH